MLVVGAPHRRHPRHAPDARQHPGLRAGGDGADAAGAECAVPRGLALQPDPQVAAAQTSPGAKQVGVVDLTRLLCDAWACPAVVGGALAFKDEDHLTPVFAATLAPYLRRGIDQALR